jgi:hypothetical protein
MKVRVLAYVPCRSRMIDLMGWQPPPRRRTPIPDGESCFPGEKCVSGCKAAGQQEVIVGSEGVDRRRRCFKGVSALAICAYPAHDGSASGSYRCLARQ